MTATPSPSPSPEPEPTLTLTLALALTQVRWLRQNDGYARAVARAGRARMSSLDVGAVTDFMAEVLREYSRRMTSS